MDLTGARWRKVSRSASNGTHCVEVAAVWRKASRSGSNGTHCVEVAGADRTVAVRDSKNPDGPKLAFNRATWTAFTHDLKSDAFGPADIA